MAPLPHSGTAELDLEAKMQPCPGCDGEGKTFRTVTVRISGTLYPAERYSDCPDCEGAGEVPCDEDGCPNCGADPLVIYNADREPYNPHAFICQACGHE